MTEAVPMEQYKAAIQSKDRRVTSWRGTLEMNRLEAYLLWSGLQQESAYNVCQRVNIVSKRAGGLDKLSAMDERATIPILFPRAAKKYQASLQVGVRAYRRSKVAWQRDPSILVKHLRDDLAGPIVSWRMVPLLVEFHQHVMESERIGPNPADGLCQRLFTIVYISGLASFEDLKICDVDLFVYRNFQNRIRSFRCTTRRAIRTFQVFSGVFKGEISC